MDIDLRQVDAKQKAAKLIDELTDYRNRMRELGRAPVLRLKRADYLYLREYILRTKKLKSFGRILMNGEEVLWS